MAEYERRSKLQRQRINYALSEKGKKPKPPKIPVTPPQSPKSKKKVTSEPDYLHLVPMRGEHQNPEPPRDSPFKGKEPIPIPLEMSTEKQTPLRHTPPDVRGKLPIEGPKEPVTNTSQKGIQVQKQVVPYKPEWPDKGPNRVLVEPLGGNTIPIKYSKEIGRNGGIERPTSTEAGNSQDSAIETVKQSFHNGSPKSERVPSDHSGSQEELVWDYNDGIGRGNDIQQPKDVTPDIVQETKEKEMRHFGDPLASLKNLVAKQIRNRKGLITMPISAGHKTYKRKTGDPKGKIYSDEGTYGDERDDLWARGKSHTSDEADLFDMFCTKCQGDHLSMFCPVGRTIRDRRRGYPRISRSEIKKVLNKECNVCGRPNGMHHRECPLKKYTGCWCCGGQHYQKDCPQAGIQRELEKARRYSEELHAELFYNQGGAIRFNKLTKQQKKDIQKQQPVPQPESSVKEPFEDVKRRKIEDEEIFKKPKDGVRPPQKAVPKENKVQAWIEEQSKVKYQPEPVTERYTSPMKEFEESEKEQRKMTPSPKEQRIP